LVCVLWLAGCTEDPEPIVAPPSKSSSPAVSKTPTETPEPETPEEFIRRWSEADTLMQNTGDPSDYLALTDDCSPCRDFADRISGIYEAGGSVKTQGWEILKIKRGSPPNPKQGAYLVTIDSRPTVYTEAEGEKPQRLPGGRELYKVDVVSKGSEWRVLFFSEFSG
jgi:hypothetical protein